MVNRGWRGQVIGHSLFVIDSDNDAGRRVEVSLIVAGPLQNFEELECWQQCRRLRLFVVRQVLPRLPREERHRLGDQLLRAARSTSANIVERYGRFRYLDNAKFCTNARGSCYEVLDHLITARDENLIPGEFLAEGRNLTGTAVQLLNGYLNYLKRAQSGATNNQ